MKSTLGAVPAKGTALRHFTEVPENAQSEAYLQPHPCFLFSLEHTVFHRFCNAIFTFLFKVENDSNFAFMLKFL